ncbi:MAG: PIN domain-containing protein [Bryobacteraceae bacterium]|jgi:predicted nucleic acid-binding protein
MLLHRRRRRGGVLSPHAITTIHYLIRKDAGAAKARQTLKAILRVFGVAMVDERVALEALEMPSPDFEDSVTAAAAALAECDLIVTRDPKGFRGSPVQRRPCIFSGNLDQHNGSRGYVAVAETSCRLSRWR